MPELPEVETVARELQAWEGQRLQKLELRDEKVWFEGEASPDAFHRQKVERVFRHGKYLVFDFGVWKLLGHLRMTGKFLRWDSPAIPDGIRSTKQIRALLHFEEAPWTFYDTRRFGTLTSVKRLGEFWQKKGLAPDPLAEPEQAKEVFQLAAGKSKRPIKALLLDQSALLGAGNIYADEALFSLGIHPLTPADKINKNNLQSIFAELETLFTRAIAARGTSAHNYLGADGERGSFQDQLQAYGRGGEPCRRCGRESSIMTQTIAGRTAHFCLRCQPRRGGKKFS